MSSSTRGGFSLLEVILALTILAGAIAAIGSLDRMAMDHGAAARNLTRAQILCRSKLEEVTSGAAPAESVGLAELDWDADESGRANWLYSVDVGPSDQENVLTVRVTVLQNLPNDAQPIEFSLTAWMLDPTLELLADIPENMDVPPSTEPTTSATSSSGSSGGNSSGGNNANNASGNNASGGTPSGNAPVGNVPGGNVPSGIGTLPIPGGGNLPTNIPNVPTGSGGGKRGSR